MFSFWYIFEKYIILGKQHPCFGKDMDLKNIVGNAATFFTVGVFLAGIEICRKIWRKKSTCDISPLPFLCGLVSCCLWFRYGFLINDSALMIVNSIGGCLQIAYILWYAKFTVNGDSFYKQLAITLAVILLLDSFMTYCVNGERARYISGLAACSGGLIFMASPLATVAHVLRSKTSETLPFAMILCTFIMATLWLLYGVLTDDFFVQVPNFLGALLSLAQLCLFAMYSNKKPYYELGTIA